MAARKKSLTATTAPKFLPPIPVDVTETIDAKYLEYALYVIGDRAVPSVCDGLKPVARRILWDMLDQRAIQSRPHVKCARISGSTIGRWHAHGDLAVYEALVRLAQPFSQRVPLIDFHGNLGSPDFGPASSRYTEARLGNAGMALLHEVKDGTVPMTRNYDETEFEPVVLPAPFPHLLINGAYGIAVGIASFIPPHNPAEVCAAAQFLIENPRTSIDELRRLIVGPDFPGGGVVTNSDELDDIYRTGEGVVRVRGTWEIETEGRSERVVVTSLPYSSGSTGGTQNFIKSVIVALEKGVLTSIDDIVNESSEEAVRIVVHLAKGVTAAQILPSLVKNTTLSDSISVRCNALDANGLPQMYNLLTMLEAWVAHRIECIRRRSERRVEQINERLHVLKGLWAVLLDLDAAVAIIRGSDGVSEARTDLMDKFSIDEIQANFVLDLTLRRLTRMARVEIEQEIKQLEAELARLEALLASPGKLRRQVGKELGDVSKTMGWELENSGRTTLLVSEATGAAAAPAIVNEAIEVAVTTDGYVQSFKASAKAKIVKDHPERYRLETSTATQMVLITSNGQLHRFFAATIPSDKPTAIQNVVTLAAGETVLWFGPTEDLGTDVLLVTGAGMVKRIAGEDLAGGDRKGGISIVKLLDPADRLVSVLAFDEKVSVLLMTAQAQAIRFTPDDVRPMGRTAAGVRAIRLIGDDRVVGAMSALMNAEVLVVHESGAAKRYAASSIPKQNRAGKGVVGSKAGGKQGSVRLVAPVTGEMMWVLTSANELSELRVASVPAVDRAAVPGKIRGFDDIIVALA